MNRKNKKLLKNILLGTLCVGTVAGVASAGVSIARHAKENLKEITPTFNIGSLNEQGEYSESEDSLYSKDIIKTQYFEIDLDFDSSVSFDIYFYNDDESFLSKKLNLNEYKNSAVKYDYNYFRLVIHPNIEDELTLLNKYEVVNDLNIQLEIVTKIKTNEITQISLYHY